MSERPSLIAYLHQRRRNTFGKAYPLVGYDELQALLAEVARIQTRTGIALSLVPASQVAKFHERCEALGVKGGVSTSGNY